MLTLNKMKKMFWVIGFMLAFSSSPAQAGCMPINPICLFKMILKVTPGLPVFDFASVPAIIPHVPAALLKEGQAKLKEIADNALEKLRSGQLPSLAEIKLDMPSFDGAIPAESEEFTSLEAFPQMDAEDPLEVAKAIEVIFLRPGWDQTEKPTLLPGLDNNTSSGGGGALLPGLDNNTSSGEGGALLPGIENDKKKSYSTMTQYDKLLMEYYQNKFKFVNVLEIAGYTEFMQGRLEELMTAAEDVQKQIESADDLNKAQRANYAAHLMEYQLMIVYNQLLAAELQLVASNRLKGTIIDQPIFGNM